MAVLIKDMEMPKYCSVCPCETDNVCEVEMTHLTFHEWTEHRPSWCPLVEVRSRRNSPDMDKLLKEAGLE